MTVCRNTENNLLRGDACSTPLLNSLVTCTLSVSSVAGSGEGRVGSSGGRPSAVEVIVLYEISAALLNSQRTNHDHEVIENAGKTAEVGRGDSLGIVPGEQRSSSGKVEVLALGLLAELLEECEKVGSVIVVDHIASETLPVRVLPTTPG